MIFVPNSEKSPFVTFTFISKFCSFEKVLSNNTSTSKFNNFDDNLEISYPECYFSVHKPFINANDILSFICVMVKGFRSTIDCFLFLQNYSANAYF